MPLPGGGSSGGRGSRIQTRVQHVHGGGGGGGGPGGRGGGGVGWGGEGGEGRGRAGGRGGPRARRSRRAAGGDGGDTGAARADHGDKQWGHVRRRCRRRRRRRFSCSRCRLRPPSCRLAAALGSGTQLGRPPVRCTRPSGLLARAAAATFFFFFNPARPGRPPPFPWICGFSVSRPAWPSPVANSCCSGRRFLFFPPFFSSFT